MSVRPKIRSYSIAIDDDGRLEQEGGVELTVEPGWAPEDLVLAALARCMVTSLGYHARRDGLAYAASATASGDVGARECGRSWGFLEIDCTIEARLDPPPDDLRALLARGERGCFVGSSLTPKPRYRWIVNGEEVA